MKKIFLFLFLIFSKQLSAQCHYEWAQWTNQGSTDTAVAMLTVNGAVINMTMTANFNFDFTPGIFNYPVFSPYANIPANGIVPRTTWAAGLGGQTTMCFSQPVVNPVLLLASVGSVPIPVSLNFSTPYNLVFDGGGNTYPNSTTINGAEGNCIIEFPGTFTCVTIFSTTLEFYTNITWGVRNPLTSAFTAANQCQNNSVSFTNTSTINSPGTIIAYNWDFGDGTLDTTANPVHSYSTTGTYNVQLVSTSNSFCTDTFSTTVTVYPSYNINNPVSICSGQSYTINSHTYSATGTYYDTLSAGLGCDSIITTQLTVSQAVNSTNPQTICSGGSYTFNSHTYTTAGNYYDTLSTTGGCDSIINTQLTVNAAVSVNNPQTLCGGGSYTFNNHVYTTTGNYYDTLTAVSGCDSVVVTQLVVNSATPTNNPQAICPGGSYSFNSHIYSSLGNYFDTLQTSSGCDSIIQTTITISQLPAVTFDHPADICFNDPAFALDYATPAGGIYSGPGIVNNILDPKSANVGLHYLTYSYTDPGTSCVNTVLENITVRPAPVAHMSVTPKKAELVDPRITYIDLTQGNVSAIWDFGDNNTSTDVTGFHLYNDTGHFQVKLIVTDAYGCMDTTYATVFIDGKFEFYVPNVFTPNGDGINDSFSGIGVGVDEYVMKIFDRWGKEVFETKDLSVPWSGKNVPGDTYVYKINLMDVFGSDHEYVGKVSVVR